MRRLLITTALALSLAGGLAFAQSAGSIRVDSRYAPLYHCFTPPFKRAALDNSRGYERQSTPLALALAKFLKEDGDKVFAPQRGWYFLVRQGDEAAVGHGRPLSGSMRFQLIDGVWKWQGSGSCTPRAHREEAGDADWRVDPKRPPGPRATRVRALVLEQACNNGQDARGRVLDPWVHYGRKRVTVTYFVAPQEGLFTCPSNPETPVTLVLEEPLGDRELIDGSTLLQRPAVRADPY